LLPVLSTTTTEVPSSTNRDATNDLDGFCMIFRRQMATALVVPVLMAKKIDAAESFVSPIREAYSSFGIAWRLLDDLQDMEKDMTEGVHSSLYVCLPAEMRKTWDQVKKKATGRNGDPARSVLNYILMNGIIETIRSRICSELESAVSLAGDCHLQGFAEELHSLLEPLKIREDRL
jgi:hypothetical protein